MNKQDFKEKQNSYKSLTTFRPGYSMVVVLLIVVVVVIIGFIGANKAFKSTIEAGNMENLSGGEAEIKGFVNDGLEGLYAAGKKNAKDEALQKAVMEGNTALAKITIQSGANVNLRLDSGATLLHRAAINGSLEIVQMLIENEANVDAKNKKGQTPLHWAAKKGNIEIVELLIQSYADFDIKDNDGKTVLNTAVSALKNISKGNTIERQQSIVDLLRSYGAKE